jgi:hypothetical protein
VVYDLANGILLGSTANAVTNFNCTASLRIGSLESAGGGQDFGGHIKELRITKGVGRYIANYTVPTGPFPRGPGNTNVWNGSAWGLKPTKVWNGSAWVTKPVKVWNGSIWR